MRKTLIKSICLIFTLVLLVFIVCSIIFSPEYMIRIIRYGESDIKDYLIFDNDVIIKSDDAYIYPVELYNTIKDMQISYKSNKIDKQKDIQSFLQENQTTSFIVVKNDIVIFEEYYNGYNKDSINTSFSCAKSLVSLMIGIAIDDGYIKSVDDEISEYIKELKESEVGKTTIKDLLLMRSNIKYEEGNLFFGDDAKTYYIPDLRELAIKDTKIDKDANNEFHYNNYHPLLLGLVLENATGVSVPQYFEQKVWKKIGSQYDASWSVDSKQTRFAKMESGFNFRAIDFAKIGSMMLHEGVFNGNQIASGQWIAESTIVVFPLNQSEYNGSLLDGCNTGYKYMWYSMKNGKDIDYFAVGKYGQFIYVSPQNNTVVVRTGYGAGDVDWWADALMQVVNSTNK